MKKIAILLILILALSCLAGCGAGKGEESAPARRDAAPAEEKAEKAPEAPAAEQDPAPAEEAPQPETDGEAEAPGLCTYTVHAADPDGAPVAGVMINFCTDESCTTVTTDERGTAVFTGEPYAYHVQILKVPKGLQLDGEKEFITELCDQSFELRITEAEG